MTVIGPTLKFGNPDVMFSGKIAKTPSSLFRSGPLGDPNALLNSANVNDALFATVTSCVVKTTMSEKVNGTAVADCGHVASKIVSANQKTCSDRTATDVVPRQQLDEETND